MLLERTSSGRQKKPSKPKIGIQKGPSLPQRVKGEMTIITRSLQMQQSPPKNLLSRRIVDLHQAIRLKDAETVRHLIMDLGVDLNAVLRGTTPLSLAICLGNEGLVRLLVENGANVNKMSRDHNDRLEPPLYTACRLGKDPIVRLLIDSAADVNKTDFYGQSPLWIATRERRLDLVTLLLDSGAVVNSAANKWSECPLYLATKYLGYTGRKDIAKLLVRNGINVNVSDEKGRTPLYWALKNCDAEVSRILVVCGAKVEPMLWATIDKELPFDLKNDPAFYPWLKLELTTPFPLQRLCRNAIRNHIARINRRSILDDLTQLPLPTSLIKYLALMQE